MTNMFEPNPVLLGFIFVKRFVFVEVLLLLALLRMFAGGRRARWTACVTALLGLAALTVIFGPAFGWTGGDLYRNGVVALGHGSGMTALLVLSAVFSLSAVQPDCRWRWLDWTHLLLVLGLLGLWAATLF